MIKLGIKQRKRLEEKRKHDQVDKARDKEEPRLTEKRQQYQVRNQEDKMKAYGQSQSKLQYQKKLRSTHCADTGFEVICSCCLQYKNITACQTIDVLSAKQQKKLTIKSCSLHKNRSKGYFICGSCKMDIDKDKNSQKKSQGYFQIYTVYTLVNWYLKVH